MKICAVALVTLATLDLACAARAQQCYSTVQSWQGNYTLAAAAANVSCGSGNGETCNVNQSASASGSLVSGIAPSCTALGWTSVGPIRPTSVTLANSFTSPCPFGGTITQLDQHPTGGFTDETLNLNLTAGSYTFEPTVFSNAIHVVKGCNGDKTSQSEEYIYIPVPGGAWPPQFTLPPSVEQLTASTSFQALAATGGAPASWTFDFTLTPHVTEDDDCKKAGGSTIGCQNQSLGESIRVVGTGFRLHYESSRAPGAGGNAVAAADAAMIGGWTLNVHHAYDPATHTLFLGDGGQRNGYQLGTQVKLNGDTLLAAEDGGEVYVFDATTGRHARTLRSLTGAVAYEFGYDAAGKLVKITDAIGNQTTIRRSAAEKPTAIVSPYGQTTALKVDGHGFLREITDLLGHAEVFTNTAAGLLTSRIDANGNTYAYSYSQPGGYNQPGGLIKDADPAGGFTALARTNAGSGFGWTVGHTTAMGRTSSYQNTINMPWVQDGTAPYAEHRTNNWPGGLQATADENLQNGSLSEGFALSNGTSFSDTLGPDPVWGIQVPVATSATLAEGDLTMSLAATRDTALKKAGNPFSVTSETDTQTVNGRNYTARYTGSSRSWVISTPVGRTLTVKFDALERVASAQVAGLLARTYVYDDRGRVAAATRGSRTTAFAYDADGFLAAVTDPLQSTTHFTRDPDGRLMAATQSDGRVTSYGYDANGNLVSLTPPGKSAHKLGYDAVNRVSAYTPPAVAGTGETTFAYDLDHYLTRSTRPDGATIKYGYDDAGRLVSIATPTGTTAYLYATGTGNLASAARGGETIAYAYDGPLPTKSTWSGKVSGNIGRVWNADLRIASQSVDGGSGVAFTYDSDLLLTQAGPLAVTRDGDNGLVTGTKLGAATDSRNYNGYGELVHYTASAHGTALYDVGYTRDDGGRITAKTEKIGGVTNTYAYTYDIAGRLVKAEKNGAADTYDYDSNSNRLSAKVDGVASDGSCDAQDRLLRYGSAHYAYTANGELAKQTIGGKSTTYGYDVLGNLIAATLPDGTKITYVIDAENHRVGKAVNGKLATGFLYDGDAVAAQLDGGSRLVSQFVYGTRATAPDYMLRGGVTYRIFSDQLGSPVLVVNAATGAVAERIAYDAFGNVTEDTNPGLQPFRFAGGLYDPDIGLLRFGARDYDPNTGRWTAKDRVLFAAGDTNLYAYALGDPVNLTDVSGLQTETAPPDTAEAAVEAAAGEEVGAPVATPGYVAPPLKDFAKRLLNWIKHKVCRTCEKQTEGIDKEVENNGTTAKELAEDQTTHVVVEATEEVAGEAAEMEVAGEAVGPALTAVEAEKAAAQAIISIKVARDIQNEALNNNAECH